MRFFISATAKWVMSIPIHIKTAFDLGLQQRNGPVLELVRVLLPQSAGAAHVLGLTDHIVVLAWVQVEGGLDAVLHQRHRQVGDVDSNPLPPEFLRRRDRRPAAAERVQYHITFLGRDLDDAFQQAFGFLSGVSKPLVVVFQPLYILINTIIFPIECSFRVWLIGPYILIGGA